MREVEKMGSRQSARQRAMQAMGKIEFYENVYA